eukprot:gene27479-36257_t
MSNSRTPSNRRVGSPRISRASNTADGDSNSVECSSPNGTSNRRREIEMKREIKRMEDEANYTFAPKSVSKKQFVSKDADEDRFMTLYTDAKKRHLEQREEKLKQKYSQDLTFTPKFSTRASSRSNSRDRGQSIGDRLYNATPNKINNCPSEDSQRSGKSNFSKSSVNNENTVSPLGTRSISSSRSNKSYQSECSFTPTISKRAKSIDRSSSADRGIGDRLYSHSKIIREKLEKVKAERDHKAAESCTFVPKTNSVSTTPSRSSSASTASSRISSVTQKRINDRMKEFEENKTKKIENALHAKLQQETAEATFKPQLVAKRLSTPLDNIPVHERLSQPTEKDLSDIAADLYMENTFQPQLVARRVSNPVATEYASATERLYQEGERRKKEIELERQQQLEDRYKECTFSPKLGFGGKRKEKDGDEPAVPVFDRLASLNSRAFMDEILSKIKSEIEMKDCTFQPKIPVSHAQSTSCNKDEPVYIRLNREAEIIRAEKIRREAEKIADELASATFSPCLPSNSIEIARRHMMYVNTDDEDVYSRLSKCSPKPSFDFENDSYDFDCESINSSASSVSRSKSGGLPEQEVDRIVQRLYSSHTKSSEKSLRISREENSEQLYEKKSNALPEKVLEKVFRRLSLTSSPCSSAENNTSSFIDNPMSQSKHRRSISQGDSVLVYVPDGSGSRSNSNSPTKIRVPAAVAALNARTHFTRRTSTTPRGTSKSSNVAMTADESYAQYSCSSESKDIETELDQVNVSPEIPQQLTDSFQPQPEQFHVEVINAGVVQSNPAPSRTIAPAPVPVPVPPAPEKVLTEKKSSNPSKLRRTSISRNPPIVAEPSSTPGETAQNVKPSKEFLSKIQKFSPNPAVSLSSTSIEEKITAAAAAVGMTKIAGTTPSATGPSLASLSSSSVNRTKSKSTAQTVASSHNQHQRAHQLATSSQDIDDKWESNASKILRGQKKKTEQPEETASENNYGNIIMT